MDGMKSIGAILLEKNLLTQEQVAVVAKTQKHSDVLFGQLAVYLGFLSEDDLLQVLSELYDIETVSLEFMYIDKKTLMSINYELACSCKAVPFFIDDNQVKIAIADAGDIKAVDALKRHFGNKNIKLFLAKESEILYFSEIIKCNAKCMDDDPLFILNKTIFDALNNKASDIHFEPMEKIVRIRMRVDGVLNFYKNLDAEAWQRIQSKLKLIANLNITENRRPQSGHTRIYLGGKTVDLRISTHPNIFGESFVIRIFDLSAGIKSLSELGFSFDDFNWLKKVTSFPNGIFLIVGPTGAGKTTTLYSILKEINSPSINIMTLEDPIEYQIEGIRQLDLREEGILSFANGVKSILRQDPDVMLIGEIRDEATALGAIRASLTGRLVLATLHAATPIEGIRRLVDLGLKISDFIPSIIGVFSQRLVRYLKNGRYEGRFPITEYLFFSDDIKHKLLNGGSIYDCKPNKDFKTSASEAIKNGLTDLKEINRVLGNADI